MLEPLSIDVIGFGKRLYFFNRGIRTIVRMQPFADCLGIQNSRNLKLAEFETVDRRLQFAF